MTSDYPRDLIGYGEKPPHPNWPNQARIALQFVVNYEEGGENSVLHGDGGSEQFLSEIIGAESYQDRHLSMESIYEYGSRSGFWRLHRLFNEHNIPVTVFGVATALEKNPDAVEAMLKSEWEIASHGLRWIHYQHFTKEQEKAHIEQAIEIHERVTGSKPKGWYTGRTSPYTLELIAEREDILYCADSYADDLPYWENHYSKPLFMVPYTLDTNDMRFATPQGFNSGEQFFQYLKDAFDELYREGATQPKMLSIGLHCRLVGRPARLAALRRFIEYTKQFEQVWYATREQIAQHWLKTENQTDDELDSQVAEICDISAANTEEYYGLLDGKRLSVKDLFDVKGYKTGAGLPSWAEAASIAKEHAKAVSLLVESGAFLTSKTQLDELAYSLAGNNSHYGVSRNPFDAKRVSGGSSSGAAVSVSTRKSDIGLATDTGGSIRVPASYCGLYGMRPTYGRVPVNGLVPLAPRFDTAGVLTRDIKLLESSMKALFSDEEQASQIGEIERLVWCEELWSGVDDQVKQYAKNRFDSYTGEKTTIGGPILDSEQRRACFSVLQAKSIWDTHGEWLESNISHFGQDIQTRLKWGQNLSEAEVADAESLMQKWQSAQSSWLAEGSALLIPTVPGVAPLIESYGEDQIRQRNILLSLTSIAGLSGWPQLQCPAINVDGLPIGISLLGRENSDIQIIKFAQDVFGQD